MTTTPVRQIWPMPRATREAHRLRVLDRLKFLSIAIDAVRELERDAMVTGNVRERTRAHRDRIQLTAELFSTVEGLVSEETPSCTV